MLELKIQIDGETYGDLEIAIEEVLKLVGQEYVEGFDGNDTSSFSFSIVNQD